MRLNRRRQKSGTTARNGYFADGSRWPIVERTRSLQTRVSAHPLARVITFPLLVGITVIAYWPSFDGVFLLDDIPHIINNHYLRCSALSDCLPGIIRLGRPLVNVSLLLTFRFSGLNVSVYHLINLIIHVMAGLALHKVLAFAFSSQRSPPPIRRLARLLSTLATALWLIHPLNTQAVTYLIQRAELMYGLCTLLAVYSFHTGRHLGSFAFCLLAISSKPMGIVTAPSVLLWDSYFISGSVAHAIRRHRPYYAALFSSWPVLGVLAYFGDLDDSSAFVYRGLTSYQYLLTQCSVISHYLYLAMFLRDLVFDYGWLPNRSLPEAFSFVASIGSLLAFTLWSWSHRYLSGAALAFFFLWLAPSSSIFPIKDLAFEHRMYLPLAALSALTVGTIARLLPRIAVIFIIGSVLFAFGVRTYVRNIDYTSAERIWQSTVDVRPLNPRARNELGIALFSQGRVDQAMSEFQRALELDPDNPGPAINIARIATSRQDWRVAETALRAVERRRPDSEALWINWGELRRQQGRHEEALECFRQAIRLMPTSHLGIVNLSRLLLDMNRPADAVGHLRQGLQFRPDSAELWNNLGTAFHAMNRWGEAVYAYERARDLAPALDVIHMNLGNSLRSMGRRADAISAYQMVLTLNPGDPHATQALQELRKAR